MMSGTNEVQIFTAQDIILNSFPPVAESVRHSSGTGLHKISFKGELKYWETFSKDVRSAFKNINWKHHQRGMSARVSGKDVNYTEYYICGAEISTSARYATHVLNPVSGVAQELGHRAAFSDWTAAGKMLSWPPPAKGIDEKNKRSIPDYALLVGGETRALGEAKHPWGTRPDLYIKNTQRGVSNYVKELRRFLGQVARDMWAAEVKYAFMTNYKWTVFLRREKVKDTWTLFYSDAIHHNTKSDLEKTGSESVSVRECMLFLTLTVCQPGPAWSLKDQTEDRGELTDWVHFETPAGTNDPKSSPAGPDLPGEQSTTGQTFQLPERPRNPDRAQIDLAVQRAKYKDVGKLSVYNGKYGELYKFYLNDKVSMSDPAEWDVDPNNPGILYHDEAGVRGSFQTAKVTPGDTDEASGKGKARESPGPVESQPAGTLSAASTAGQQLEYIKVKVRWNKEHTGYNYAVGDATVSSNWVIGDSPGNWQEMGQGKIFNSARKLLSDKP
ncbi:uncharacterized protein BDV17DRAFT_255530 [Aspergillus undulatus]|uniref:uncharacterized protein n=1 Tax=Aspergillus undulatus TaxID=1810928 RepID=UPI003CCCD01B